MTPRTVFLREATGLVRTMSRWDALMMNYFVAFTGPMSIALYVCLLAPTLFPGGNYVFAALAYVVVMIPQQIMYSFVTASMPRTGGDYVFNSRTIHPIVGLFGTMSMVLFTFGWVAMNGFMCAAYLGRLIGDFGGPPGWTAWAYSTFGTWQISVVVVMINALVVAMGLGLYCKVQKWVLIPYIILTTIVCCVVFWIGAPIFHQSFNQWAFLSHSVWMNATDPYQAVIQRAASMGYPPPTFSWAATGGVLLFFYSNTSFVGFSIYTAGEMKNAGNFKNQALALMGSTVIAGVSNAVFIWFYINMLGYNFYSAIVPISSISGVTGTFDMFMRIIFPAWQSGVMPLTDLFMLVSIFFVNVVEFIMTTRVVFAWSFDRLLPGKLATISERFKSPTIAIVIAVVLGLATCTLLSFTSLAVFWSGATVGAIMPILITSICVTIFPYVKPQMFELSPVNYRIKGIPAMTISGIVSTLAVGFLMSFFLTNSTLAGWSIYTVYIWALLIVVSFAIYYVAKIYQKRQGIDIGFVFREIPPE